MSTGSGFTSSPKDRIARSRLSEALAMASLNRSRSDADRFSISCRNQWAASRPWRSHFRILLTAAASTIPISPLTASRTSSTCLRRLLTRSSMYLHPWGNLLPFIPWRIALTLPLGGPLLPFFPQKRAGWPFPNRGAGLAGAFLAGVFLAVVIVGTRSPQFDYTRRGCTDSESPG